MVAVDDGDAAALAELDDACRRAGVAWLRTAAGERTVEVGPLFDARHTGCYACFAAERPGPAGVPSPARAAAWAALIGTEIVHLLSRVGVTSSMSGAVVFDLGDWTQSMVGAYRRPGCLLCLPTRAPSGRPGPGVRVRAVGGVPAARMAQPQGPSGALPVERTRPFSGTTRSTRARRASHSTAGGREPRPA
nr:hypothetical protein GCM10020092_054830 [Actinoplanes digitatis]